MPERFQTVLLFGAPGAGKGTQGAMLGRIPGFHHFSTGDMFRSIDRASKLGKIFAEYSTRGELVPDDVTVDVWKQYINAQITLNVFNPGRRVLVLDGMPRNRNQALLLEQHIDVLAIVFLCCASEQLAIDRLRSRALKEKRPDDAKEEVIQRRLEVYKQETSPVLGHYPGTLVHKVDAAGSPAGVLHRVLGVVTPVYEGSELYRA